MIADISFLERRIEEKNNIARKKLRLYKRSPFYAVIALIIMITGTLGSYLTLSFAATATRRAPFVFQGRITDANYIPIADSTTRRAAFRIHTHATNTACVWSTGNGADTDEAGNCAINLATAGDNASVATTITRGVFSVPLGDTTYHANMRALRLDFDNQSNQVYYLEISIKNDSGVYETLSPRVRIGSSAYAYNADELDGINSTGFAILAGQTGGQVLIGGTATTDDLTLRTTTGVGADGADMIFQVGNNGATEAMRILNSGNVGIGDTSPDSLLNIQSSAAANNGIIVAQTNAGDYDPFIQFELTDGTANWTIGVDDSVTGDPFKISGGTALGGLSDMFTLDSRTNTTGVTAITLTGPMFTTGFASAAAAEYTTLNVAAPTIILTGGTGVTTQMDQFLLSPSAISNATAMTVSNAAALTLTGAPAASGNLNITNTYALKINTASVVVAGGTAATTNSYGLYIDSMTSATNNYAAVFAAGNVGIGDTTPDLDLEILNSSTTADGGILITKTDGNDRDPVIQWSLTDGGTPSYTLGVDDSDSDKLKFGIDGLNSYFFSYDNTQTGLTTARIFDFTNFATTFTAAANNFYRMFSLSPAPLTLSGTGTTDAAAISTFAIDPMSVAAATATATDAISLHVRGAPRRTSGTLTNSYGIFVGVGTVGTVTTSYGLYVNAQTEANTNYAGVLTGGNVGIGSDTTPDTALDLGGTLSYTPSTTQTITAVGNAILANATLVVIDPNADYTLTSTPTIADGATGQILYVTAGNTEANTVTLQDQDTLASSNLQLGAATRAISGKDVLVLMFDGTDWIEVSYSNN